MGRVLVRMAGGLVCGLLLASVAVAAAPITNGVYTDPSHGVSLVLGGKNVVTPTVKCHGSHWYPTRGVHVSSSGAFSYSGKAAKQSGFAPPRATNLHLTINGTFVTSHRATGKAKVDGCTVTYTAKYRSSHA